MKIAKIQAREIFDSRGMPTIECVLYLDNGVYVTASVPSGLSTGIYEAHELRDNEKRLMGFGVLKAIKNIETVIAPALLGEEPQVINLDAKMLELDDTPDKKKLGANAILAVSIAVLKAQAKAAELELYELVAQLCDQESVMLPFPLFNMINGGVHVPNGLRIQEFLVIPAGAKNFRESMEYGIEFYYALKELLQKKGQRICMGIEGGFAPAFENDMQALDILVETIEKLKGGDIFKLGLDVAASQFYDEKTKTYDWNGTTYTTDELIKFYKKLVKVYPICSIEDGLAENDGDGWARMMEQLGETIQIIGDDIFVTNTTRIYKGIIEQVANGAIIKPNQVGTVTETLQAIQLCKEHGMSIVVSHRSGETNDTFIADLAVGTSIGQIKAGGCSGGERLAKYNRLLAIEDQLAWSLLED